MTARADDHILMGMSRNEKNFKIFKEEIKSENRDEFELKLEFGEQSFDTGDTLMEDVNNESGSPQQYSIGNLESQVCYTNSTSETDNISSRSVYDERSRNFSCPQTSTMKNYEENFENSCASRSTSRSKSKLKKQDKFETSKPARTHHQKGYPSRTNQRFLCSICERSYSTYCNLKVHALKYHDEITRHECYFCKKRVFAKKELYTHMSIHTKERPFTCLICGSTFSQSNSRNRHIKSIHQKALKSFKCTFNGCNSQFIINSELTRHMRRHTKEKPFVCSICTSAFSVKSSLNKHIKLVHQGSLISEKCTFKDCKLEFSNNKELTRHMRTHKKRSFTCLMCGLMFYHRRNYNNHIEIVHQGFKHVIFNYYDDDDDEYDSRFSQNCIPEDPLSGC